MLQVMEDLKEALSKTTKALLEPELETLRAITEDFQDVEISVRGLKMSSSRGFKEALGFKLLHIYYISACHVCEEHI